MPKTGFGSKQGDFMSVNVTLRVVGLYCYAENTLLNGVDENSFVKDIMNAFKTQLPSFDYTSGALPHSTKEIVDSISYDFSAGSQQPPNSSVPSPGPRSEANVLGGDVVAVWQYYRTVTIGGPSGPYEVKLITPGQPSFATTRLNQDLTIPSGYTIGAYNLTWRLVKIEMTPEKQAQFMKAKLEAMS